MTTIISPWPLGRDFRALQRVKFSIESDDKMKHYEPGSSRAPAGQFRMGAAELQLVKNLRENEAL